ncbi:hypothetical protein [Streptomyces sp. AK02-04a]|uniref:hypothetical protein n=1 Tax=Streptomyces sp. AK02-04a TaxID=3028649 RepID=UPI0029BC0BE5|nr:hypothetical protein [Streptomyces sp. AK02-04a]MDX3763991.1 hypothetical protein [Streptomyces sp. AK02-04a]
MNTKGRHRRDLGETLPSAPTQDMPKAPKKRRRWFMWAYVVIQMVFLLWVIGGARTGAAAPHNCGMLTHHDCNAAQNLGTAIGVGVVIVLWAVVSILLGVTFGMVRFTRRP